MVHSRKQHNEIIEYKLIVKRSQNKEYFEAQRGYDCIVLPSIKLQGNGTDRKIYTQKPVYVLLHRTSDTGGHKDAWSGDTGYRSRQEQERV